MWIKIGDHKTAFDSHVLTMDVTTVRMLPQLPQLDCDSYFESEAPRSNT